VRCSLRLLRRALFGTWDAGHSLLLASFRQNLETTLGVSLFSSRLPSCKRPTHSAALSLRSCAVPCTRLAAVHALFDNRFRPSKIESSERLEACPAWAALALARPAAAAAPAAARRRRAARRRDDAAERRLGSAAGRLLADAAALQPSAAAARPSAGGRPNARRRPYTALRLRPTRLPRCAASTRAQWSF